LKLENQKQSAGVNHGKSQSSRFHERSLYQ
jgi:hypothetical protein